MNLRVRRVTCESAILTRGSKGPGRAVRRVRRALEMRDAQKKSAGAGGAGRRTERGSKVLRRDPGDVCGLSQQVAGRRR